MNTTQALWGVLVLVQAPLLPAAAAGTPRDPSPDESLRVVAHGERPPLVWQQDGKARGLVVDLLHAAAARSGLAVTVDASLDWQAAQARVLSGEAEAILQMVPTPQREQLYAFSTPLVDSHLHLFRKNSRPDIQSLASLAGKRVGVAGTDFALDVLRRHDTVTPIVIPDWSDAFGMLARNEVDAVLAERCVGEYFLSAHRIAGVTVVEPAVVTRAACIAVRKDNRPLLDQLNAGLAAIARDGARDRIEERWRAKEVVYVTRESIRRSQKIALGAVISALALAAAAAMAHSWSVRRVNRELREARDTLEQRVEERTASLKRSEERFARIFAKAPFPIVLSRSDRFADVNEAWCRLFGVSRSEAIGRTAAELGLLADPFEHHRLLADIAAHGHIRGAELRGYRAAGRRDTILLASIEPIELQGERFILCTAQDITERKRAEEALRASEEQFRRAIQAAPIPIVMHAADGHMVEVSDTWTEITGYGRRDITTIDAWIDRACRREDADEVHRQIESLFSGHARSITIELPVKTRGGRMRHWSLSASAPGVLADGRRFIVAMAVDMTERMRAESLALENEIRQKHELAESNQALEAFAYAASHDLQEPLRMVSSFLTLLDETYGPRLDEKARTYIGYAVEASGRMSQLITDLLAYSRVTSNRQPPQPISLQGPFDVALANLRTTMEESGAAVTHDALPTAVAEPAHITQLFQNLIGNAIKFRCADRACRIHVGVRQTDDAWVIAVQDNGIGIAPLHLERVFRLFERLHGREQYPGTGIGLALCRRIVKHLGGRIWVDSEPDRGSTFSFTLPRCLG